MCLNRNQFGLQFGQLFEASNSNNDYLSISAAIMTEASADERGTVQALARELDEARADGQS